MSPDELRALSVKLEDETMYDSIPTIERIYQTTDSGAYECPWPTCVVVRRDPVVMWRHVHFGMHGKSFGRTFEEVTSAAE